MLQKQPKGASSDRRKLLLQVRTNEVSENLLQKRPKGALSDRRERRTLASLSKAYKNTYRIELRVGHQTRMMFDVWHQFGVRWYRLVDKVGKNYVSNRYDGGDGMMSDDVMDFLDCIWEDVREIHELHKGRELNV